MTQIATIDFETYFDAKYSLRSKTISTSEYIRDERFEALCASIKLGNGIAQVYWGHDEIQEALDEINWKRTELLAHHTQFEGLILSHHFRTIPAKYRCTLSMGRAIFPKTERNDLASLATRLGVASKLVMPNFKDKHLEDLSSEEREVIAAYVAGDVEACAQAYIKMLDKFPAKELELIDLTVRMFAHPVLVLDEPLAKKELKREQDERELAITGCGALKLLQDAGISVKPKKKGDPIGDITVLSSNKLFPEALKLVGVIPPLKKSKTTGKPTYAISKTDEAFTDLALHEDPRVVKLVRGRLAAKSTIGETRAARLLQSGSNGQHLPVYLNFAGAHTYRWSGGDKLNYQNFKKTGDLRKAIKAPKGYSLVVIDSSQIEARMTAWLAEEEWLLDVFRNKGDPYCEFATTAYGRLITKADKLERFVGKTCVLGLGFQMGGPKLQKSLITSAIMAGMPPVKLELNECYKLVKAYRDKNAKIEALWTFLNDSVLYELANASEDEEPRIYKCITYGREYIGLPSGLKLLYPEACCDYVENNGQGLSATKTVTCSDGKYDTLEGESKLYGGLLTENVVQALARIVVADQMLKISERYRVVMMTHDEVVFLVPTPEADYALKWGLEIMHTPPAWAPDLPVAAEGGHDVCYSK